MIDATLANAAGLTYTPAANANGNFTLTMATDDLGNTGIGGPLTVTNTATITLSACQRPAGEHAACQLFDDGGYTAGADGNLRHRRGRRDATVLVILDATNGTLAVGTTVTLGVTPGEVFGNGSGLVTLLAPLSQIDATLADANGLVFTPVGGFAGTASLTVVSNDMGNTGSGGPMTDTRSESITVARVLDHFSVVLPTTAVAGVPFAVTLTARDNSGAVVGNYAGTVNLTTFDPQASGPATATFTAGVATFQETFKTAGSQTISAADVSTPSLSGHGSVTVVAAAANHLVFGQQPTTALVGAPFLPAVSVFALDPFGNVATTDSSDLITVRVLNNPSAATLTGTTSVELNEGVAQFPTLQLSKAGNGFTIVAYSPALQLVVSNSFNVVVVSGFSVTTTATTATAGTQVSVTVSAIDSKGQVVTGYAGTVHISSSDAKAGLPADATLTQGQGSFSVTLKTAGARTISALDVSKPSITGTLKKPITVTAAAVNALSVTSLVNPSTVGLKQTFTVSAIDAFGNVNSGYRGSVTLTSTDRLAVLPSSYTFTAKDAGIHPFTLTLNTPGLRTITAGDGSVSGTLGNILVAEKSAVTVVQADPEVSNETVLVIIGTAGNDTILISPANAQGTELSVSINNVPQGSTFSPTGHLIIYGLGGNNTIRLLAGTGVLAGVLINLPAVIIGGQATISSMPPEIPAIRCWWAALATTH